MKEEDEREVGKVKTSAVRIELGRDPDQDLGDTSRVEALQR